MINIENNNPPVAVENKEKIIKRLEKIENFFKRTKKTTAALTIGGGILVGGFLGGISGAMVGATCGAIATPALAGIPVAIENLARLKITSLRRKMSPPSMQEMLDEQQKKTQSSKNKYASMLKEHGSNYLESEREDIAFQEKKEMVFRKAMTLAKEDNKEKTVQRLMSIASEATRGMSETREQGIYTTIGGIASAIAIPAATKIIPGAIAYAKAKAAFNPQMFSIAEATRLQNMPHYSPGLAVAVAATAVVAVAATACCAARTVQSYKEQKAAKRALNTLEEYVKGR